MSEKATKIHKVQSADDIYSEKRNSGIEQCFDYRASWRYTAIAVEAIVHHHRRVRFVSTVELVNALEQEKRTGHQGRLANRFIHADLVILDELGYLPFSQAGGALLFHLSSKLYEKTSVIITTNLSFSEWKSMAAAERALALDPDSADIMEDYASLLVNSWQLDAARRVAERMVELNPQVPIFLFTLGLVNHTSGEFEERDRNVQAALNVNPDLGNIQYWKFSQFLQYGQFDKAREYAVQMDPKTVNTDDVLSLIDWVSDPGQAPTPRALAAMEKGAGSVPIIAGRYDIWLDMINRSGAEWPEWKMTETISLLAPLASPELMHQYRADPRTMVYLAQLRLPEYWRKVGWPEVCRPLGEDDFECF